MTKTVVSKDGEKFVVLKEGNNVFVGTTVGFSELGAQMRVREAMKPAGVKPVMCFRNIFKDNMFYIGVGYLLEGRKDMARIVSTLKQFSKS